MLQTRLAASPGMGNVVEARGLRKRFGAFEAVAGVDLNIPRGVCFGLLGPNGAGKTTLIRMMMGVSPVDAGTLTVLGTDVTKRAREVKARLGVVPQEDNLDPDFTVRNNLLVYARFYRIPREEAERRADRWLDFVQLSDRRDASVPHLSGGMKRRLVVARALMSDPELLVLDEPTTGLDPQARHAIWDKIRDLRRQGRTILLTTHYMDEAEMLCDTLVIMDQGKIHEQGHPRELVAKHTGGEAVEFVSEDPQILADVLAAIGDEDVPAERLSDRIVAYGQDLEDLHARIRERFRLQETILRRATLEDVFLRLTGRALRD